MARLDVFPKPLSVIGRYPVVTFSHVVFYDVLHGVGVDIVLGVVNFLLLHFLQHFMTNGFSAEGQLLYNFFKDWEGFFKFAVTSEFNYYATVLDWSHIVVNGALASAHAFPLALRSSKHHFQYASLFI